MALYTDPEEIYLMKKTGDVIMYDATKKQEKVKISNVIKVRDYYFGQFEIQFLPQAKEKRIQIVNTVIVQNVN